MTQQIAPRTDLYTFVHKGQRRALFDLTARAGSTDPSDLAAVAELIAEGRGVLADLHDHSDNEHRFIHPLFAERAPEIERAFEAAHVALDPVLDDLARRFDALEGAVSPAAVLDLYRALARFTGVYLAHIDEEEATLPVLWERFSEVELSAVMAAFRRSRTPAQAAHDREKMLPGLHPGERARLLAAS